MKAQILIGFTSFIEDREKVFFSFKNYVSSLKEKGKINDDRFIISFIQNGEDDNLKLNLMIFDENLANHLLASQKMHKLEKIDKTSRDWADLVEIDELSSEIAEEEFWRVEITSSEKEKIQEYYSKKNKEFNQDFFYPRLISWSPITYESNFFHENFSFLYHMIVIERPSNFYMDELKSLREFLSFIYPNNSKQYIVSKKTATKSRIFFPLVFMDESKIYIILDEKEKGLQLVFLFKFFPLSIIKNFFSSQFYIKKEGNFFISGYFDENGSYSSLRTRDYLTLKFWKVSSGKKYNSNCIHFLNSVPFSERRYLNVYIDKEDVEEYDNVSLKEFLSNCMGKRIVL